MAPQRPDDRVPDSSGTVLILSVPRVRPLRMKLADWMHKHHLTPRQLRRMLGVKSRTTVGRWLAGERIPSERLLQAIETITGGAVTREDFLAPRPPGCLRLITDRGGRLREVYPWTEIERHKPRFVCPHDHASRRSVPPWEDDPEDVWPSPPLQLALDTLQGRACVTDSMEFVLDGRRVDARRLVAEANRVRGRRGLSLIAYPGVHRPQ